MAQRLRPDYSCRISEFPAQTGSSGTPVPWYLIPSSGLQEYCMNIHAGMTLNM